MVRVKGRLEFAMWVTLSVYQAAMTVGVVETILNLTVKENTDFTLYYLPGANVSSRFLIWVIDAYFIFAMKDVYNRLTIETPSVYLAQRRKEKIVERIIYSLGTMLALGATVYFFATGGWSPEKANQLKQKVFWGVFCNAKILCDCYIYLMFYFVFTYMFQKRFVGEDQDGIDCKTRFIQVWTFFIFALNAFISFMTYLKSMWLTINGSFDKD